MRNNRASLFAGVIRRFLFHGALLASVLMLLMLTSPANAAHSGPVVHFSYARITLGSGPSNPMGVAVDGSGNVFVADYYYYCVIKRIPHFGYSGGSICWVVR